MTPSAPLHSSATETTTAATAATAGPAASPATGGADTAPNSTARPETHDATKPVQPLLHDETVLLRAPSQLWSASDGSVGDVGIHGFYHGDTRVISGIETTVGGAAGEHIATARPTASRATLVALLRHLDDDDADPRVRLLRERTVGAGELSETITIESTLTSSFETTISLALRTDFSVMHVIKAGLVEPAETTTDTIAGGLSWRTTTCRAELEAENATVAQEQSGATVEWRVTVPAKGSATVRWSLAVSDSSSVVDAAPGRPEWDGFTATTGDSRLATWLHTALDDLDALRMVTTARPEEPFLAAGAPWFFTLFGRDSIWAARLLLPLGTRISASTLRVLAGLQGTESVDATAEQPGKIMHELRPGVLTIPGENVSLPPLYFGTVDATALWVCLLHDAWRWGMPDDEVEALLPHLEAALAWLRDYGDSDGDGFLEYVDTTGHGLANQGWKDSGDSIQWRDGRLAEGPIALCEVQAYAYEAAVGGAALLERFGRSGEEWRLYAAGMKARFTTAFWIDDEAGGYPAIALDAHKRPVDTVTSNIGHLLGTGILEPEQAAAVAARLVSPSLDSGYGLRTLATDAAGYWPLSYHGGSVWAHDTAIAIVGLGREGFAEEAGILSRGLLAAAEGFGYRMPELHSGDAATVVGSPVPYPAACRPQAWSAAAAVAVLSTALGLTPEEDYLKVSPVVPAFAGPISATGIRYRGALVPL